jgi:hypothetical protein
MEQAYLSQGWAKLKPSREAAHGQYAMPRHNGSG